MGASAEIVGRLKGGRELVRFASELCAADAAETETEHWIHVLPSGPRVEARDGRSFTVDNAQKVVDATELPMLIDWEHASETSSDTRAAGWIEELQVRSDGSHPGIWGRVRWTPQGREHVATQHYRFLSPVVLGRRANSVDRKQLAVEQLASVALTNRPALRMHGIEAFRAACSARFGELEPEGDDMKNLAKLVRETCGLAEDTSEEALVSALEAKLKPKDESTTREALSVVTAERNTAVARVTELERELASFQGEAFTREVEVFFDKGSRAGKIAPAARKKWLAFAQKSRENFATFRDVIYPDLPVVVPPNGKGQKPPKRERLSTVSENGVDREALRRLGFTEEQIVAAEAEVFGGTTPAPGGTPAPKPPVEDDEDDDDDDDADEGDTTDDENAPSPAPAGG